MMPGGTQSKPLHQVLPEIEYQGLVFDACLLFLKRPGLSSRSAQFVLVVIVSKFCGTRAARSGFKKAQEPLPKPPSSRQTTFILVPIHHTPR